MTTRTIRVPALLRIVAALVVAAAGVVPAQRLPDAGSAGQAPEKAAAEDYFTESRVVFPEAAGPFTLQRSARDPDIAAGVSLLYRYDDDFDAEFDVFVFPLGHVREKDAMKLSEAHLLASFEQAQKLGYYENVDFKRTRNVRIPLEDGRFLSGRHLRFSAVMQGQPSISHTIIAYRDSYVIKLRASSSRDDKRKFEKLVDASVDALLPKISVQSIGACSERLARVNAQAGTASKQDQETASTADQLLRLFIGHAANGCVVSFDSERVPPGMKTETLRFPPGSWSQAKAAQSDVPAEASKNP